MRYRGFVAGVTDVPHLDAALPAGVDVACGVTDGDSTHHFSVAQGVDLSCVARDARTDQCIRRKRNRLHLSISAHVEGVGPGAEMVETSEYSIFINLVIIITLFF